MKFFKKVWTWIDDRSGISELVVPMAKHKVPPDSKWLYVFGSATLFCLILQIVTGVSLSLMYQPSSGTAYQSLQFITNHAPLGNFLRGLHYFGASAMILLLGIHMIRVYVMASYKYPRELSWITGVVLLGLTIGMGFTGQLLRWDNNGVWSAVVAAEQAGRIPLIGTDVAHFLLAGKTIGGQTLSRFFSFHVFLIPAMLFTFVGFHIYLVLRNGISEPPKAGRPVEPKKYRSWYKSMLEKKGVPFFPDAAWRDIVFGFSVIIVIVLLAIFVGAPKLSGPPDPSNISVAPKPDWYLLWIYALFALMPPKIESYVIFFGPLIIGMVLLSLPFLSNRGERSPIKRPWAVLGVIVTVSFISAFWMAGIKAPWSPAFNTKPLPAKLVSIDDAAAQHGEKLFYKKGCQYCHSIRGQGGHKGPDLTYVGERLTPREMTIRIVNGGGQMPAFGASLNNKELSDLVAFLQTRTEAHDAKLAKLGK